MLDPAVRSDVIRYAPMADPSRPRILVIRRRYLGDIVLLGPVFRNLRLHWPAAHLAALVEAAYAPVLSMNPDVDEALSLPRRAREWPAFLRALRRGAFTHVLDLDNNDRTAWITWCSGAAIRIALWHEGGAARWRRAYTASVHDLPAVHESRSIVDYYLSVLGAVGVPVVTREVALVPRSSDRDAMAALAPPGTSKLLIHPGSRSAWRIWPAANFAAVADAVQDTLGVPVLLVGGPSEAPLLREIQSRARLPLVGIDTALSVPRFAALASHFDLLLCHDSGPMHVAAAVGTRVVALLGSQNPVLFAPPGQGQVVIRPPLPCVTCATPGECQPGDSYRNRCVQNIPVARVLHAVASHFGGERSKIVQQ